MCAPAQSNLCFSANQPLSPRMITSRQLLEVVMSRFMRWIASNGTRAFALAAVVGLGGFASLTPTQAEARDRDGRGWSDNRRDNGGRFDRGRNNDRGDRNWQRRSGGRYDSRAYYAPRYYRYTPPRPWYWTQPRPGYYGYYDYGY
jgi:hypothetical protein